MSFSLNALYKEVGLSKQAVFQYDARQKIFDQKVRQMVLEADALREYHPGCGVEKMYYSLKPGFIGRDRFVELMMDIGYRLKRKKNYKRTTIASKIYYPNHIKGMVVDRPSMIWQSDITYIPIGNRHYYAVFIIDVYTKKIVGYKVSDNMRAQANMEALNMALKDNAAPLYHHSDRGSQYIFRDYIKLLRDNGSEISMALSAQDNAYAERINRTIKEEYLSYWQPKNFNELKHCIEKAVKNYNNKRPHNNIGRMTPTSYSGKVSLLNPDQREKLVIFNNEINI
ncbi:IS3 family transposase [Arenibacter sp. 6A1]|uniref:IS3 family transposase n=1 Tax=Arenibacter sp. 6A1 TaxID=2720391 RepID=UPI001444A45E|nr:IS3 family transposase [Arenibacter sp. 6A1]NKI25219.1 IS3 family transposase [Arenibacter sp. 6A1]